MKKSKSKANDKLTNQNSMDVSSGPMGRENPKQQHGGQEDDGEKTQDGWTDCRSLVGSLPSTVQEQEKNDAKM